MTARKLAEQAARRANTNLMRVSWLSAMGAMASTLSHELNQPIGAASNFIAAANEHVKRTDPPDADLLRNLFKGAVASCQRAGQIIRRMRDFTASGTVSKKPEMIRAMVDAAVDEYSGGAANAPITFDTAARAGSRQCHATGPRSSRSSSTFMRTARRR